MVGRLVPMVHAAGARGIRRLTPGTAISIARLAHSREIARNKYPRQMAGYARQSKKLPRRTGKRRTAGLCASYQEFSASSPWIGSRARSPVGQLARLHVYASPRLG